MRGILCLSAHSWMIRAQYADLLQDAHAQLDVAPEPKGPV